ncbi:MAG TPA: DUF354 domain-containing protein [Gammaproteobacteria bacterium]|nr:DUF354 domain-containing protein [Gammaproteobacteria bacterium]
MKILCDVCHPAHVHFFKNAISQFKTLGHEVLITARNKDCTLNLLNFFKLDHTVLTSSRLTLPLVRLGCELVLRNKALLTVVREWKPDIMIGVGGIFIAHIRTITRIPAIIFYDGDNALLQNILTYPFASKIYVPDAYQGWTLSYKTIRYAGFHELAYLHPKYFLPSKICAIQNGLHPEKPTIMIRLVAWKASHDFGHKGLDREHLLKWIENNSAHYHFLVCAESNVPERLKPYVFRSHPAHLHHVLAYCHGFLGESPTMAMEAAIMGVPALYVSTIQCGNVTRLQGDFQLIQCFNPPVFSFDYALPFFERYAKCFWMQRRADLLHATVDVTQLILNSIFDSEYAPLL